MKRNKNVTPTKQSEKKKEKKWKNDDKRRTTKNKFVRCSCSKRANIYDYDACNTEGSVEENQTTEKCAPAMNSGSKLYELRINELTSDKLKNYGY